MIMSIEFITIPQSEYDILTRTKKNTFTSKDWEILVEYWDVFKKFLTKVWLDFQLTLGTWKAKWEEEKVYSKIEGIWEIISAIDEYPKAMQKYQDKKAEEKEKKDL